VGKYVLKNDEIEQNKKKKKIGKKMKEMVQSFFRLGNTRLAVSPPPPSPLSEVLFRITGRRKKIERKSRMPAV